MKLSPQETRLIQLVQDDFPLVPRPYAWLGEQMGLSETMVLELIQGLVDRGVMRKLAAVVRHREVGYVKNVLVVWSVPVERVEMVGALFAAQKYVTHCYERTPPYLGRYNVFTMVHYPPGGGTDVVESLARLSTLTDYVILESVAELKKTSPRYG